MFLAKLFSKSRFIDANRDTHMLFAPNYLIKEQPVQKGIQYIFGGHSVINIQTINGQKELNFLRTRAFKTNQVVQHCEAGIKMGFRSIADRHFLIFSFNPAKIKIRTGDELCITFENEESLVQPIVPQNYPGQRHNDTYIQIDQQQLETIRKHPLKAYTHTPVSKTGSGLQCLLSTTFTEAFQEVAETYQYALLHLY